MIMERETRIGEEIGNDRQTTCESLQAVVYMLGRCVSFLSSKFLHSELQLMPTDFTDDTSGTQAHSESDSQAQQAVKTPRSGIHPHTCSYSFITDLCSRAEKHAKQDVKCDCRARLRSSHTRITHPQSQHMPAAPLSGFSAPRSSCPHLSESRTQILRFGSRRGCELVQSRRVPLRNLIRSAFGSRRNA